MTRKPYSASVELRLIVGTTVIQLAQLGPSHAIVRDHVNLVTECSGRIETIVDNRISNTISVFLPNGIRSDSKRFEYF